jgi:hypothetical protein
MVSESLFNFLRVPIAMHPQGNQVGTLGGSIRTRLAIFTSCL